MDIPQPGLPEGIAESPFTLGQLAEEFHKNRRMLIRFIRKERKAGKTVSVRHYLSSYIESFYSEGGNNRCVVRVDDPSKPRDMAGIQVLKTSIPPEYQIEMAESARALEEWIIQANKKRKYP